MHEITRALPKEGLSRDEVIARLARFGAEDPDYHRLRTWSLVYYLGEEHTRMLQEAHAAFFSANGLNPMAFKSLKRFESEVVAMTGRLLGGDDRVCGTMTSGGTESCLLAVKTYRDLARAKRPWIRRPEMVIPKTAHVAWEKGAHYFGVKAVHAPLRRDLTLDVDAVRRLVNRRTIMILGSAPEYPYGMVDPIAELGRIAARRGIPLHVDACLGGFMLPFVEKLGHHVPPWDFRVPGVTSISADVHKYGFAAKGASTIVYRDVSYLKHQMFVYESWPGGIFASPAILGTRPGGSIAAAWAAMTSLGEAGYLENARVTMETTRKLHDGIRAIPPLEVVGSPTMSVFAYRSRSRDVNIFAVADALGEKGWHVDRNQSPDAIHAMVTPLHAAVADDYLADLREAVAKVLADPSLARTGGAAMYGLISHVPLRGMIKKTVLDTILKMYGPDAEIPERGAGAVGGDGVLSRAAASAGLRYLELRDKVLTALART
jgi:glutamate/tyrosine decarboxylase-like PLP-dependent enzyme